MLGSQGEVKEASPSIAVQMQGLNSVPVAGDTFHVCENEAEVGARAYRSQGSISLESWHSCNPGGRELGTQASFLCVRRRHLHLHLGSNACEGAADLVGRSGDLPACSADQPASLCIQAPEVCRRLLRACMGAERSLTSVGPASAG